VTPKNKATGIYVDAILSRRGALMAQRGRGRGRPVATHKFAVGAAVFYSPGIFESASAKGVYRVVSLLPSEGGDNQYRVKSDTGAHERVVCESQLSLR